MKKLFAILTASFILTAFVLPAWADDEIPPLPEEVQELLPDSEEFYGDDISYDYDNEYDDGSYGSSLPEMSGSESVSARPSWYPDDVESFTDFHNQNAPRVVDNADLFSDSEEAALTKMIGQSIAANNIDFVIYTDTTNYGLGNQTCAADFYQFNGYGIGDDYNGSVLYVNMDPYDREFYTAARGACRQYYTEETVNDLQDRIYDDMHEGDYYTAMDKYIEAMNGLYKTGKVPEAFGHFLLRLIVCIVIALIGGGITMGVLTSQMKKVQVATRAQEYLVRDSVNMRAANDYFLYATVTRTKIPKNDGKGGGSSFSGGFSSSGGGSFSGGGRKF